MIFVLDLGSVLLTLLFRFGLCAMIFVLILGLNAVTLFIILGICSMIWLVQDVVLCCDIFVHHSVLL